MKKTHKLQFFLVIILFSWLLAMPASAQFDCNKFFGQFQITVNGKPVNTIEGLPKLCTPQQAVGNVIQLLLEFAALVAVVFIILGGFWYLTAAGNEEQSEKGRKAITSAIIGLVVIIMAYAIVRITVNLLTSGLTGGSTGNGNTPAVTNPSANTNTNPAVAGTQGGNAYSNPMFAGISLQDVSNARSTNKNYLGDNIVITPKNPGLLVNSTISTGERDLLAQIAMICGDVSPISFTVKVDGADYMQSNYTQNASGWAVAMASQKPIQPGQEVQTFVCGQATNKNLTYPTPGPSPR